MGDSDQEEERSQSPLSSGYASSNPAESDQDAPASTNDNGDGEESPKEQEEKEEQEGGGDEQEGGDNNKEDNSEDEARSVHEEGDDTTASPVHEDSRNAEENTVEPETEGNGEEGEQNETGNEESTEKEATNTEEEGTANTDTQEGEVPVNTSADNDPSASASEPPESGRTNTTTSSVDPKQQTIEIMMKLKQKLLTRKLRRQNKKSAAESGKLDGLVQFEGEMWFKMERDVIETDQELQQLQLEIQTLQRANLALKQENATLQASTDLQPDFRADYKTELRKMNLHNLNGHEFRAKLSELTPKCQYEYEQGQVLWSRLRDMRRRREMRRAQTLREMATMSKKLSLQRLNIINEKAKVDLVAKVSKEQELLEIDIENREAIIDLTLYLTKTGHKSERAHTTVLEADKLKKENERLARLIAEGKDEEQDPKEELIEEIGRLHMRLQQAMSMHTREPDLLERVLMGTSEGGLFAESIATRIRRLRGQIEGEKQKKVKLARLLELTRRSAAKGSTAADYLERINLAVSELSQLREEYEDQQARAKDEIAEVKKELNAMQLNRPIGVRLTASTEPSPVVERRRNSTEATLGARAMALGGNGPHFNGSHTADAVLYRHTTGSNNGGYGNQWVPHATTHARPPQQQQYQRPATSPRPSYEPPPRQHPLPQQAQHRGPYHHQQGPQQGWQPRVSRPAIRQPPPDYQGTQQRQQRNGAHGVNGNTRRGGLAGTNGRQRARGKGRGAPSNGRRQNAVNNTTLARNRAPLGHVNPRMTPSKIGNIGGPDPRVVTQTRIPDGYAAMHARQMQGRVR